MNLLPTPKTVASTTNDLSQQLQDLTRYGRPRLSMTGGTGWFAAIEMNTNTTGTSFEVKSDFNHPTPDAAVAQCAERVHAALKALTGTQ